MTPGPRLGHDERVTLRLTATARAVLLGALALLAAAGVVLSAIRPLDDGAVAELKRSAFTDDGVRVDVREHRGLRDGDVVLDVDGRRYEVRRDGRVVEVDVQLGRRSLATRAADDWGGAVLVPSLALIGALLLWRRPDLRATRVLFVFGNVALLAWVLLAFRGSPADLDAGRWWLFGGGLAALLAEAALLHFVLVFPGRPPRRRWLVPAAYVGPLMLHALDATVSTRRGTDALGAWSVPRVEPLMVAATLAVPLLRLRRMTDPLERRQLRVLGLQLAASGAVFLALFAVPEALGHDTLLPASWASVPFWAFPVALAVSVLRFDLFEIRVLVHRSLLYGTLVLGAVVVVIAVTGDWVAALLAGAIALAAQPARRLVDRVVYRAATEPYEALAELGRRLEDRASPTAVLEAAVETVARSLARPYAAIETVDAGVAASYGEPTPHVVAVPLVHQRAELGRLVVARRDASEELGPSERRLVTDLAAHVGTALAAARFALDVQRSRERLVVALEEERRRVGRDLHDGLGPRLAAASMKLEVAGRMARRDLDRALELHGELRAELTDVIGDVRRLVYALRPPALDQLGLPGALRELANRLPMHVSVHVDGPLPDLPAAVEVAAYRIAGEAMTNAARHAGASTVSVRLCVDRELVVEIVDDGHGMPDPVPTGVGVSSMHERANELGGAVTIDRPAGGGTRLVARLPLEDP
jgi:two-component system NarL family sensor kinase